MSHSYAKIKESTSNIKRIEIMSVAVTAWGRMALLLRLCLLMVASDPKIRFSWTAASGFTYVCLSFRAVVGAVRKRPTRRFT